MLVEFMITPVDGSHMSRDVAHVVEILEQSGLNYQLGPMGTAIEGDWPKIMHAIQRCHEATLERHPRVITTLVIDDHRGHKQSLREAVQHVERHRAVASPP